MRGSRDKDKAYRQLVKSNFGRLTAIARSYADRESYEDLRQEMLYQLWCSYPSFQGTSQLDTWVYRVALNTAITYLRGVKRRPKLITNLEEFETISTDSAPEDAADILETFMLDLNRIDRAILILYLDDRSHQQIAEITGQQSNTVAVRLTRMKARFKKQIEA